MFIDIPTPEKILIIFNPISSVGNTRALAHRLGEFLVHHGKLVEVSESEKKMKAYMRSVSEISAYDLLVVVGGMVQSENYFLCSVKRNFPFMWSLAGMNRYLPIRMV